MVWFAATGREDEDDENSTQEDAPASPVDSLMQPLLMDSVSVNGLLADFIAAQPTGRLMISEQRVIQTVNDKLRFAYFAFYYASYIEAHLSHEDGAQNLRTVGTIAIKIAEQATGARKDFCKSDLRVETPHLTQARHALGQPIRDLRSLFKTTPRLELPSVTELYARLPSSMQDFLRRAGVLKQGLLEATPAFRRAVVECARHPYQPYQPTVADDDGTGVTTAAASDALPGEPQLNEMVAQISTRLAEVQKNQQEHMASTEYGAHETRPTPIQTHCTPSPTVPHF